jgi:peroxiredoxin
MNAKSTLPYSIVLLLAAHALGLEVGKPAPAFSLDDQFGATWKLDDLKDKVVVMVAATRESGNTMGPWVDHIKSRYASQLKNSTLQRLGLMDLHTVPGIGRGFARSRIRRETKGPLMIDFNGATARAYQVNDKHPVVVVIDKEGVVKHVEATAFDGDAFRATAKAIDAALSARGRTQNADAWPEVRGPRFGGGPPGPGAVAGICGRVGREEKPCRVLSN